MLTKQHGRTKKLFYAIIGFVIVCFSTKAQTTNSVYEVSCWNPDCTNRFIAHPLKVQCVGGASVQNEITRTYSLTFQCPKCSEIFCESVERKLKREPMKEILK